MVRIFNCMIVNYRFRDLRRIDYDFYGATVVML